MPRALNVILQIADTGEAFNINEMGLMDMTFDRMPVTTSDTTRSFLPEIQITMRDRTGSELLSILQRNSNNLLLQYGYDQNMSAVYKLTAVRLKISLEGIGSIVTVQAVGSQIVKKSEGEIYLEGTRVDTILRSMAARNGWYIGEPGSIEYVDVKDVVIPRNLVQKAGTYDYDFILDQILPVLKQSLLVGSMQDSSKYWEVTLTQGHVRPSFFCRPYSSRDTSRRVWIYHHGSISDSSEVIRFTNDIDMTYLLNGISVRIPMTATDMIVDPDASTEELRVMANDRIGQITDIIKRYNLPIPDPDNFLINVEIYEGEDLGNKSIEEILLESIENAINVLSTAEMVVVGNPKIMPTDLIQFTAKTRDGSNSIISSTGFSYWRVKGISESIGLSGYQTTLNLVRENSLITVSPFEQEATNGRMKEGGSSQSARYLEGMPN